MGAKLLKTDRRAKKQRVLAGRVAVAAGTPSISAGQGFTIADTAAGKVTVTLQKPAKAIVSVQATPIESTDATAFLCKIHGVPSASAFIVSIYQADATDGVLVDNVGFSFQAIVQD